MSRLMRRLVNWWLYERWTDCEHDWYPVGFADWQCTRCGALR